MRRVPVLAFFARACPELVEGAGTGMPATGEATPLGRETKSWSIPYSREPGRFRRVDGRMRPSLREHRGLLEGERKSRFLHSAVACAPAPVGMTRLLCNGRCWPNAPVGSGPLAPHSRRKTWATTLGGKMGNVPLARFIQNQLFIMKRYKRVHLRGSAGWE